MQHLFRNILKEQRCARKSSDRSPVINHRQGPIKMFVKFRISSDIQIFQGTEGAKTTAVLTASWNPSNTSI